MSAYDRIDDEPFIGHPSSTGRGDSNNATADAAGNFETSLDKHIPLAVEAILCYALGITGAVILLIAERKSDYIRFHAYQSAFMLGPLHVLQIIFAATNVIWMSLILLLIMLGIFGFFGYMANKHSKTLHRMEVPLVGPYASRIVDSE